MRAKVLLLIGLVALYGVALAQPEDTLQKHPGYVDFSALGIASGAEPTVEVFLKGSLLKLLAGSTTTSDPELSGLLRKLEAIRVQTYELDTRSATTYAAEMARIAKRLEGSGWETIVRVREKGEQVDIAIKSVADRIVGLTVMSVDKDTNESDHEVALINIVGDIDLAELGHLGQGLHISPLDSLQLPPGKTAGQKPR